MSKIIIPEDVAKAIITINDYCSAKNICNDCFLYDESRDIGDRCKNILPDNCEIHEEMMEVYVYDSIE